MRFCVFPISGPPAAAPGCAKAGTSPLPRHRGQKLIRGPENRPRDGPDRRALEKLTVELPGYLMDAIKRDAIDRHTTARHVVLLALQSAGFTVEPADLVPYAPRRKAAKP